MNKFALVAQQKTCLSPLFANRTKIKTDEVIEKYPDGITLMKFDIITAPSSKDPNRIDTYPIFTINEDESVVLFGGKVLYKLAQSWAELYEGNIEEASRDLSAGGGCKIKLVKGITRAGNNVTRVEIIG